MQFTDSRYISFGGTPAREIWYQSNKVWGNIWTPNQISTIFWYDAADISTISSSGNQVTQMLDKSGNGWTVAPITAGKIGPDTGTRTLNGLNVLEWTKTTVPTNQILENDSFNQSQPFCIACILRFDDEGLADQDFLFSGTETISPRIAVRRTTTDSWQIVTDGGSPITSTGTATENQNYIASFYFNTTSSTIRIDGTQLISGSIANNTFTSLNIGGNFGGDQSLDGFIAELIAFANPNDQETIEGYLAYKWGLQTNLPSTHLYKNSPPLF